ncbi:HAD-like protein [Earliella scabrosa]|nr:HAD-like protein [Earliella scabrosa]
MPSVHSPPYRQCDNIVVDLADVLFIRSFKPEGSTSLTSETMRQILRSTTWFAYEQGELSETDCHSLLASEFSLSSAEVASGLRAMQTSTHSDPSMSALLRDVKQQTAGPTRIRIFAMSNTSAPDWAALVPERSERDWELFDRVFPSFAAGARMPSLAFYRHVLELQLEGAAALDPGRTVFVGRTVENVVSARSLGMSGIVLTSRIEDLARALRPLLRDPVVDADKWLSGHAKEMWSVTDSGVTVVENFSQLLLLELTRDRDLADVVRSPGRSCFFRGESRGGVLTSACFPDDLDTTSMACTVLDHYSQGAKEELMDQMLALRNSDGIVQTYFDNTRPRIDPVVAVNVLTFFYSNNRGHELAETLDWVFDVLQYRAYEDGTLYYHGGDAFLYFLSRLLRTSSTVRNRFKSLFADRVSERLGLPGDPLALAMRIVTAASIGVAYLQDYKHLVASQEEDGSWQVGWFYRYGSTGVLMGNTGLTTAMAASAIRRHRELVSEKLQGSIISRHPGGTKQKLWKGAHHLFKLLIR